MSEFCKQCSEELFGRDFKNFKDLTTESDVANGKFAVVLCEGCGIIQVDPEGYCISEDCLKDGHES